MKSLIAWDIQQVDKSVFSGIDQHSTTTGTTYIHMNQSATECRTAILLQMCVQWTFKQHRYASISVLCNYLYTITLSFFWVVTCVNVGGYRCLKGTSQLHLQDQSERENCGHVIWACDTEGADWDPQVDPEMGAAWFFLSTNKKLNYKNCGLFNYPDSYSAESIQWLDDREQMLTERPANCLR